MVQLTRIVGMGDPDWETLPTTIKQARILKKNIKSIPLMRLDVVGLKGYSNVLYSGSIRTMDILEHFSVKSPIELQGRQVTAFYHNGYLHRIQRRA